MSYFVFHFHDVQGLITYIDPGTGSMLFQAAIGGMLTLSYVFSTGFTRFKTALKSRFHRVSTSRTDV